MPGGWQWLSPEYAAVGFVVMLLAGLYFRRHGFTPALPEISRRVFVHPLVKLIPAGETSKGRGIVVPALALWAGCCVLIALAQPVRQGERLPALPPERDIVLLVDVSISMTLEDYRLGSESVSRMDMLKSLLQSFVSELEGERLAVIVFAERPYVLVPLTRDVSLIQAQLQRLSTSLAGRVSAVGDALTLALKEAARRPQRKQVMVLFTDADDSVGRVTPEAASLLAAEAGIPVYAVGMGASTQGADEDQPVSSGGLIYQPVNMALLQAIAEPTGAEAWLASDAAAVERALDAIARQQSNETHQRERFRQQPLYHWWLMLALFPLVVWQTWRIVKAGPA